eukprot:jgi/Ulvmu1/6691/UM030_0022.1
MFALSLAHGRPIVARSSPRLRAAATGTRMPYQSGSSGEEDPVCAPSTVTYNNDDCEEFTKLEVKVEDFQGLLHQIAWVLKGMEVRVRSAELQVNDNSIAHDIFYLTTLKGNKLSERRAREVSERVHDFVMNCVDKSERQPIEWRSGHVIVSNEKEDSTVITVLELEKRIGFLLEVVAVLSGIGIKVKSANVRTCAECTEDPAITAMLSHEDAQSVRNARIMQFQASEGDGSPLTERSVHAVLFTLGLVSGPTRNGDTVVPSLRTYASKFAE